VYFGLRHLATLPVTKDVESVSYDPASGASALWFGLSVSVYGSDGTRLATHEGTEALPLGEPVMIDRDHLYLIEMRKALWRWTLPYRFEKLADVPGALTVAATPTGAIVGTASGDLVQIEGGKEVRRLPLGSRTEHLVMAPDHRWLAAETTEGSIAIIDPSSLRLARWLEATGTTGASVAFDASADLLIRPTRAAITIWDRATGDELVADLDMLRDLQTAKFDPQGRLELVSMTPALLNIPRDARPVAAIIHEIACRVPLRASAGRLEPATQACP
jgi:hypothetical protein